MGGARLRAQDHARISAQGGEPLHDLIEIPLEHRIPPVLKRGRRKGAFERDQPALVGRQYVAPFGVVQKWPVLGNTDNKNPAARQGWF